MVKVEINGQIIEAREGEMLIDVADSAHIQIPRFCYHKKLSVAANCRMCLVEVEGAWKPMPACATPVTDGMKVHTNSPKARAAQKSVMEFLLINHPLDCPICDQGGECELQDVAMDYGDDVSRFTEAKRVVGDKNAGPLISTDMTRCIHCTRCVRFGQEVAGMMELGATGRSEWMEIGTYVEKSIDSEMSGNMIDLCPVGALTSKPFRYKTRTWELKANKAIAAHDSIGSNIFVHTKNGKVMRVVPAENDSINEVWISDRDRFSYEAINAEDRLTVPMVKQNGQWKEVDWETALAFAANGIKANNTDSSKSGVVATPNSTTEELHLLQKLARGLGIQNIDYRTRQIDFSSDALGYHTPLMAESLEEVEKLNSILLVGSYIRKELPLLNHRVRKAVLDGAKVHVVNNENFKFNYDLNDVSNSASIIENLMGIAKACADAKNDTDTLLAGVVPTESQIEIAVSLMNSDKSSIMVGQIGQHHKQFGLIQRLASSIAKNSNANFNLLPISANEVGAHLVDFIPLRGLNAQQMMHSDMDLLINLGLEPESDFANSEQAMATFKAAKFVVNLTMFDTDAQREYADVMLPVATFAETAGTFININGLKQSFKMAAQPMGDAKAAWKVLRVLANMLDVAGFDYTHTNEVLREVMDNSPSKVAFGTWDIKVNDMSDNVALVSPYQMDALVRRSPALQKTPDANIETMGRG